MQVSLNWLKKYVDLSGQTPEELAEKITKTGVEVDGIAYVAEKSSNVVVGYVETCEQHPNADKLNLCQVDTGEEKLQIICGAPNVAQGQKVAVAKPGAVLPGNMKIKKVKLRGVESNGMICSLQELGIEDTYIPKDIADGIFVFPEDVEIGAPVEPLLNLDDAILEFDLTPNRADCLSMVGVAYEVSAILERPLELPDETVDAVPEKAEDVVKVRVEDPDLNPYYAAFVIKDAVVKPSPLWMRNALMAAGIRPINNVVDITNYVLMEYGQPLHAFDLDRLQSSEIVVRRAKDAETIKTLDDETRTLSSENLVITNGQEPVALAGVMGGADTEVYDGTTNILLEAAYFDPRTVRQTVKQTGLRSESSTRFEKGIDPERVYRAGLRACRLLEKYADAKVLTGASVYDDMDSTPVKIPVNMDSVNDRLGTEIHPDEAARIFDRLQFQYERQGGDFLVTVPSRRGDLTIFEDMLEEIARIHGYDNLPFTLPASVSQPGGLTNRQLLKRQIKQYLEGAGLSETITYALTNKDYVNRLLSPDVSGKGYQPVRLAMPMTTDHEYLRLSILPELLHSLSYNIARKQTDMAYYEFGRIFLSEETSLTAQPREEERLSGAVTGLWLNHPWQQAKVPVDFYVVKGIIEGLFNFLNMPVAFQQTKLRDMHPGRCAEILVDNDVVGFIGQVHPKLEKDLDLNETYVFDLNIETVIERFTHSLNYDPIPKYPSIARDVAFVLDTAIEAEAVRQTIVEEGKPLVKQVEVFDVYAGEHLPDDKKSIAYHMVYQHPDKTLTDDEIEASFQHIINVVNNTHNAYVRA
ncbi:Phenylalanine--tRNA ligase [Lentibacillus sp. JNUCC-1]|uniref:phenylalanine--tRNA ligase subunit beta n=1 Tax=Lentibacillus sp. JNUCC-1 TaxID=2654513 RepID=UPI0012E8CDAE|nr:phenylalanine--tRNA ligase subunit beta [Lentibacillus sp. JNUCC-1]MUV39375.1 Phenylalanine--tRNA ligase [Lentibacillus sp. JNUCC-1]